MKDFVGFLAGFFVCSCVGFSVFAVLAQESVSIDEIDYAVQLCDENQGLDYIEYDASNYSDAYCVNGAVFMDFYVKREEK